MKNLFTHVIAVFAVMQLTSCNECKDVTCLNGGVCEDGTCECPAGFSGSSCEVEDKCVTNNVTCLNEGVCIDGECDCEPFYRGADCANYCKNGRYISSSTSCDCYPGWDSDGCTNEMRLAWIGAYSVDVTGCTERTVTSEITSMEHPEADSIGIDVSYVGITNLTGFGDTKGYGLIIDGNRLTIPNQKVRDENGTQFTVESEQPAAMVNGGFNLTIIRSISGGSTECYLDYSAN